MQDQHQVSRLGLFVGQARRESVLAGEAKAVGAKLHGLGGEGAAGGHEFEAQIERQHDETAGGEADGLAQIGPAVAAAQQRPEQEQPEARDQRRAGQ